MTEEAAAPARQDPSPLWVKLVWVLNVAVAIYLTYSHYVVGAELACPDVGLVNCETVTSSRWAYLFGVPVALLGLLYAVAGLAFAVFGHRLGLRRGRLVGLLYTGAGVLFVLYLVWAEFVMLQQVCLWCTVVHIATAVLFIHYLTAYFAGSTDED